MIVTGDQWPVFLHSGYNYDPEDPWNGLFHSALLVAVHLSSIPSGHIHYNPQAFKYIFTSPSSVDKEPKATHSGNARIHGMTKVTLVSITYIATQVGGVICSSVFELMVVVQVCFALSSSPVFSRTDTATNSEWFYNSILNLFFDPEEQEEVNNLLTWWNR
jgi:hypothetical protein